MKGIKGKTVLITGSSRGIGKAIALEFAKYGANVVINYARNKEEAEKVAEKASSYGVKTLVIQADMGKEADILAMFKTIYENFGVLDILVNNAAIQYQQPSHEVSLEDLNRVLAVNLTGAFLCAKEIIKHFIARNYPGVIINISSPHEIIPKPGYIGYSLSKGGLQNLTRTLALEYACKNIRVNAVSPGATLTPMNRNWSEDPIKRKQVEAHIPLGRAAEPEEISPSVVFLASDDAKYITGALLNVDGGAVLFPEYRENWSS